MRLGAPENRIDRSWRALTPRDEDLSTGIWARAGLLLLSLYHKNTVDG